MLLGGKGCQQCACTTGCTSKTIGGYDEWLSDVKLAMGVRIGAFASSMTLTSVTLTTDGLTYPRSIPPAANTTPVLELWVHDATNNRPRIYSPGGIPTGDVLATFTAPGSFGAGDWVFTHAGYTLSANTYYWLVLKNNGLWAYWDENCGSNAGCQAACCDYWVHGDLGNQQFAWEPTNYCGGYVYSLN